MLSIRHRELPPSAAATLDSIQALVDAEADYPARVEKATALWNAKTSNAARRAVFRSVRSTLALMCIGPVRCAYCEDSLADEVEHVHPKNLFPERAFRWNNYVFACGPCNGPKSNRYGIVKRAKISEFVRRRGDPVLAPPAGKSGLIDPRSEDPTRLLELDLGGVTADGVALEPTFQFVPRTGLARAPAARADYTIEVLGLNREVLRVARGNAFGGFRARLREYVVQREAGAAAAALKRLRDDLLRTPHLTVFFEMRRQRIHLPEIGDLLARAPEAASWPLVVP